MLTHTKMCAHVNRKREEIEKREEERERERERKERGEREKRGGERGYRGGGPLRYTPSLILNTLPWFLHLFEYTMRKCVSMCGLTLTN